MEPAGITDEEGVEMWLVTLSVGNPNSRSPEGGFLYIKNGGRPNQARVCQKWIKLENAWVEAQLSEKFGTYRIDPAKKRENPILVPANTDICRICLKYTGSKKSLKSKLAGIVQKLPGVMQSRVPSKFWKWVGDQRYYLSYQPKSDWREMKVELPIDAASVLSAASRARATSY